MRAARARLAAQRGQALTEFFIIALVLVPIFLVLPLIGKYQDIAYATEMAARYVAFDATLRNDQMSSWKTPDQLAGEVQRRFFSNAGAPIKTNDTAGNFRANQNLFWRDPSDAALIRDFGTDVRVSFGETLSTDRAVAFKGASDGDPFLLKQPLSLEARGIYRANVTVTLANLPAALNGPTKSYDRFKNINLTMTRHTDVVIDSWNARGPDQVAQRVNHIGVYSGAAFTTTQAGQLAAQAVSAAVAIMESPGGICTSNCGPRLGQLDYWEDLVPADRLR